mmetsp:Transcript_14095/g.36485  ORF Transcript_14095/g.36485 Transcript_14095/m.36485 type:complete len:258 (+) Transcript_14095:704-1477(+)
MNTSPHGPFFMKRQKPHSGTSVLACKASRSDCDASISRTVTIRGRTPGFCPPAGSSPIHAAPPVASRTPVGIASASRSMTRTPAVSSSCQGSSTCSQSVGTCASSSSLSVLDASAAAAGGGEGGGGGADGGGADDCCGVGSSDLGTSSSAIEIGRTGYPNESVLEPERSAGPFQSGTAGTMSTDCVEPSSTTASGRSGTKSRSSVIHGRISTRSATTRAYSGAYDSTSTVVDGGSKLSWRHCVFFVGAVDSSADSTA